MDNVSLVSEVSNAPILWLLCGITVGISALQAALYMRQSKKMTAQISLDPAVPKKAFRVGLISAIGPALGVFIVMVGLMASIGGPMSWFRLSIIGAAATELSAANIGAEACGVVLGSQDYTLMCLAVSWFAMALNGAGWLVFTGVATPSLDKLRTKISGGDINWLVVLSSACSLGIFGYLNAGEIMKGIGNTIAVVTGAVSMVLLMNTICKKYPKLKEYSLGIAMVIGMIFSVGFDQLIK
mgnify:FL=1